MGSAHAGSREISFPADLPVVRERERIVHAIAHHQVVVVAGETGSGKTTQLPKICLDLGRGSAGRIGHTQPRRIAARSVAERIAAELGVAPGDTVGYQVRFQDRLSDRTAIKVMTDGILLAEIARDPDLRAYDTLIIDEAHERSLNIDFLLGYIRRLLPRRPDLHLIITSATIDVDRIARHFGDAPVIEVSGRGYPIETLYRDPADSPGLDLPEQITQVIDEIVSGVHGRAGDSLVFLPGERDIRELARTLRRRDGLEVVPLYARLGQAEQNRIFARRTSGMRVVLATNIAETSITVPGIRYVVDPGLARISRYSVKTKVQRLPVEPVSKASADQRRGRCGRVAPGVCIRLYTEQDYEARPEYTDPEIRRTSLASVILQMLALGLGQVEDFPFLDPPDSRAVRDGYRLLQELGAVTARGRITGLGRHMARLPVDPRIARMVLAASERECVAEILVIAAALSVQDPRERPAESRQQADQSHARFRDTRSDFMSYINLWRYVESQRQALSQNRLRRLCQREFLAFQRLREWRDTHAQLAIACRGMKIRVPAELPDESSYEAIHRALLSGLLGNIAQWQEGREYLGCRNRRLQIFPGSPRARERPRWILAAELIETSRLFAHCVATVDPRWCLDINPALLKQHYHSPRWQPRSGRVMATERVTLYGLTISDKRAVHYGPLEPVESREILIREALVAGRYRRPPAFLRHNLALIEEIRELECRTRRRDLLLDDEALFAFYDERLPRRCTTTRQLESHLKKSPDADSDLHMARETVLAAVPPADVGMLFPDTLECAGLSLPLSYEFDPGKNTDGVSITVPVAALNRLPRQRLEWLVPGMLRDKCIALLKGLPKKIRKYLVPVPDLVDAFLAAETPADTSLAQRLSGFLARARGVTVEPSDFSFRSLDDFYRMNLKVVDADGILLAQGRDVDSLVERFAEQTRSGLRGAEDDNDNNAPRQGITRWNFGELPLQQHMNQAGVDLVAYPALADRGDSVAVELCDYAHKAQEVHRVGVLRLLRLQTRDIEKYLQKQCLKSNECQLLLAAAGLQRGTLVEDLIDAGYSRAFDLHAVLPRRQQDFEAMLRERRPAVVPATVEREQMLDAVIQELAHIRRTLADVPAGRWQDSLADIAWQMERLLRPAFMRDTPPEDLERYPVYFAALRNRVERLPAQYNRDSEHTQTLRALCAELEGAEKVVPDLLAECEPARSFRWMLEELRVSLFDQGRGTRSPVSGKRLWRQWQEVQRWLSAKGVR